MTNINNLNETGFGHIQEMADQDKTVKDLLELTAQQEDLILEQYRHEKVLN